MKDYKKILENVVNIINTTEKSDIGFANICTYIGENCPELKESEDERIRKTLIDYFNICHGDYYGELKRKDILAWLEKQGEQKPIIEMMSAEESLGIDSETYNKIVDECILGEQKPADKVEPKFHEGEWVVWKDKCYKVNYNGCGYELVDQDGLSTSLEYGTIDKNAHLWNIQDAKDGDVLVCNDNPFLFLKYEKDEYGLVCCSYCGISDSEYGEFAVNTNTKKYWCDIEFVNPATKEQRDLLFEKMHEAGYEWNADKKEAKKIEQKPTDEDMKEALRTEYEKGRADAIAEMRKPTWSEEDEAHINSIIDYLLDYKLLVYEEDMNVANGAQKELDWLKSLKGRVQPQPKHEWSEDGEERIKNILSVLDVQVCWDGATGKKGNPYQKEINWLKSLIPQNRWKPSDEQLRELRCVISGCSFETPILVQLEEDLKKLL